MMEYDSSTTVTMSLQRHKVLEAYEKAFDLMDKKESFIIFGEKRYEIYLYEKEEAIRYFGDRYDNIERRLGAIRDKIHKWSELKTKPDLYEYLRDELYMPLPE